MNDPRQTSHPDHPMYQQIERGVHAIDAGHGRAPDQTSARLTAALFWRLPRKADCRAWITC